jgi:hypothetical protein
MIATEGEELKMLEGTNGTSAPNSYRFWSQENLDPALRAFEEHRQEFIETMREIRRKNPHIDPEELQKQVNSNG